MSEFKKPTEWQIVNDFDYGIGAVRMKADGDYIFDYIGIDLTDELGKGEVRFFSTELHLDDIEESLYKELDDIGYDSPSDFMAVDGRRAVLDGIALNCAEDVACYRYWNGLLPYEVLPDVETAYRRMREMVPELRFEDIELPPGHEASYRPSVKDVAVEMRASSSALARDGIETATEERDTQEKA